MSIETDIGEISTNKYDIENIRDKIYYLYSTIKMKHHKWTNADYKDVKKYVDVVLTHNNGQYNPLNKDIIGTEQYINFEIQENWSILPDGSNLRITGFIDLVDKFDENTYEITDYKTGQLKDFLTGQEINSKTLKDDIQFQLYHLALADKYGCDKNYLLTMFFLKFAKPITITLSCDDLENTKQKIKNRFIEIHNTQYPKLNRGFKCTRFCDYGKKTFEGTEIKPIIQFLDNGIAANGQPCKICDQVYLEIQRRGPKWVQENMKKE